MGNKNADFKFSVDKDRLYYQNEIENDFKITDKVKK